MSDKDTLQQINENRVKQELRECIASGKDFNASDDLHQKVLQDFNEMSEDQKKQFTQKGWKND